MKSATRLVLTVLRYVREEAIRSRVRYFCAALFAIAVIQTTLAATGSGRAVGPVLMIGLWSVSAPLCGAWLDVDLRHGYAVFWLQKPVAPAMFYAVRLAALVIWSLVVSVAVLAATSPAAIFPAVAAVDLLGVALAAGWMPPLLIVLSFMGSALGVGNATLFAFSLLFAGLALPGLNDAVGLGPAAAVLRVVLPPAAAGLDAMRRLRDAGVGAALIGLWPVLVYAAICTVLGVTAATRLPARLGRVGQG